MRLFKQQTTSPRTIQPGAVGIHTGLDDEVKINSTNTLLIPKGTTAQRPASPNNGHMRYNTTSEQFEAYQNGAWRPLRFKEPNADPGITQQNLGNGDATAVVFGPLNSGDTYYPVPAAAQNVLVLVENVFQLATTNYTLEQNPAAATGSGATVAAGSFVNGTEYKIITVGGTDYTTIGAADSNLNTVFTATGDGATNGTGTARQTGYYLVFTSAPDLAKPVTAIHNFDK
jgi:hypothetical protein|tara:strand:- start:403 stop:1089 length:687 start_codon:yes stop_codon:yes gene_type:complete